MSYYLTLKLLGLEQLKLHWVEFGVDEVIFYVSSRRKTADCPLCHKRTKHVHQHLPPQTKRHINIGNRQSFLVVSKRRFYCHRCNHTFTEQIVGIDKWQRQTNLMQDSLLTLMSLTSFNRVTKTTGVSYKQQQKILAKFISKQTTSKDWWRPELEAKDGFILGLDGHSFAGKDMALTVTNLTAKRLVTVLPKDNQASLRNFLETKMPHSVKTNIKAVCIDMTSGKRSVIRECLPQADIIVDVFHLVADANKRVDEERLIIQQMEKVKLPKHLFLIGQENLNPKQKQSLKYWFTRFPDLKVLWFYKESLRRMYQTAKGKDEAKLQLEKIIAGLYCQRSRETSHWARMLERWFDEILNYFTYKTTNAYTEGLHTKFKLIKRLSYGFRNKQSYINKVTLSCLIVSGCLPQVFK